ncbi:hypothetical protein Lsan_0048 [Legionella santicrucis]|uniref:Conjugative transfer protein n=1 Tax=Legionella santicrucis TaxID=45074 RepID=A0A0W0ZNB2_9GAMM|nr:hypothetical protein [Legionella santicrucis]KTD70366.1 hypothetical protein Lsan_0048 [Legionella santicrucis]
MNKVFGFIIGLVFCTSACAGHNIFDELPQLNRFDLVSEGDCPAFNTQKRCSDLDSVFYGCKEIPDSLEEAHQRMALDDAQNAGGQ